MAIGECWGLGETVLAGNPVSAKMEKGMAGDQDDCFMDEQWASQRNTDRF